MAENSDGTENTEASYLFKYIILTQIVVYMEAGAVPALLSQLKEAFDLTYLQQGALGGLVYFFLSVTCPFAGIIFRHFNLRTVMGVMLTLNTLVTLAFALTPTGMTSMLLSMRSLIGVTQAFLMIYSPVWVDQFAPASKLTKWMSYLQAGVPVGVMFGYVMGAAAEWFGGCESLSCWRVPFIIQTVLCTPLALGTFFIPMRHISKSDMSRSITKGGEHAESTADRFAGEKSFVAGSRLSDEDIYRHDVDANHAKQSSSRANENTEAPSDSLDSVSLVLENNSCRDRLNSAYLIDAEPMDQPSMARDLCTLVCNSLFLSIVFALSCLYFVVNGVQFWATDYMISELHGDKSVVYLLFIVTTATAPILGVVFGGWIIDKTGGYRGLENRARALKYNVVFGILAVGIAIPCPFFNNVYATVIFLWFILFFGACILPSATGIFISAVPAELRPLASSFSVTCFNLLGYCLSPVLSSLVMTWTQSYRWGFRLTLWWSLPALLVLLFGWRKAVKDIGKGRDRYESLEES